MSDFSLATYDRLFLLDFENGELYHHLERPADASRDWSIKNYPASFVDEQYGYNFVKVFGVKVKASRVIYAMYMRLEPDQMPAVVDHINGDKLYNYIDNLRGTTQDKNVLNKAMQSNNTSGYKGISWDKREKRWHAYVNVAGKRVWQKWYKENELELAASEREEVAKQYHGEFYSDGHR